MYEYLSTIFLPLILTICALIILYFKKLINHWKNRSIPHSPFNINSIIKILFWNRTNVAFAQEKIYKEFSNERFYGSYALIQPVLFIRDPCLIGDITIKDFAYFRDRFATVNRCKDIDNHLVNLKGDHWKTIRTKLSPTFTSGKLKLMLNLMNSCAEILNNQIEKNIPNDRCLDVKDIMARFTTDVIGACAFGLEFSSLCEPDSEYRRIGDKIMKPGFRSTFLNFLALSLPRLMTFLNVSTFPKRVASFFYNLLQRSEEIRKTSAIRRNNFVQLMLDIKEKNKSDSGNKDGNDVLFDDKTIASNMFLFFLAGFEPTAITLSYCLYELALHADIQKELRAEIIRVKCDHNGNITYDALKKMTYMDMFISEVLRQYTPSPSIGRICIQKYKIPETDVFLNPGDNIVIPIYAIHHDEKYYPEPYKFDPQRFSEENKSKRIPYTYFPFGHGPRKCIAEKFAKLEIKVALSSLILRYKFEVCDKTPIPIMMDPKSLLYTPLGEIFLRITSAEE